MGSLQEPAQLDAASTTASHQNGDIPSPPGSKTAKELPSDTSSKPDDQLPSDTPVDPADQLPPADLITSWKSFTEADEYYKPENGKMIFLHTILLFLDPDSGTAYFGRVDTIIRELSMEQARASLRRVPDHEIYPPLPADWAGLEIAAAGPEHYIKRPRFSSCSWSKGTEVTAERFLEEGKMLHLMRQHPHENILKLEGCLVKNGRLQALLVKRYPTDLGDRVEDKKREPLDKVACFKGIVAGVRHLLGLGVVHNDINPSNILLDEEDLPVVGDFGGCKRFGERPTERGTPGWNEGFDRTMATAKNDEFGLRKVGEWLGIEQEMLKEMLE